jgi:hypothetical protein
VNATVALLLGGAIVGSQALGASWHRLGRPGAASRALLVGLGAAAGVALLVVGEPLAAVLLLAAWTQVVAAGWPRAGALGLRSRLAAWPEERRRDAARVLAMAGLAAAFALPLVRLLGDGDRIYGQNDLTFHLARADEIDLTGPGTPVPHFLFALLVRLVAPLTGSAVVAGQIVLVAAAAALAATAFLLLRDPVVRGIPALDRAAAGIVAALVVVADSPALLLHGSNVFREGQTYIPLNPWYSPTATLLQPLALLYLPLVVRLVQDVEDGRVDRRVRVGVLLLSLLTATAKPSLQIGLLPGLAVLLALRWGRRPPAGGRARGVLAVGRWIVLPTLALLAWQVWFLEHRAHPEYRGGFTWSPLELARLFGATRPLFWLTLLLPVGVAVAWRRAVARDGEFLLSALTVAFSVTAFLLLAETGASRDSANLGHGVQISTTLLVFFSLRRIALEWRRSPVARGLALPILAGLVGVFLAAGVASYLMNLGALDL